MRLAKLVAMLVCSCGLATAASAQSALPNLTGRGTVETRSILLGKTPQWPGGVAGQHTWLGHLPTTLIIQHETSDMVRGAFIMPPVRPEIPGVFTGDGTRFLISIKHGTGQGCVISPTTSRGYYTQAQSADIPAQVAGCNDATRQ
jgi:hypothetical protein